MTSCDSESQAYCMLNTFSHLGQTNALTNIYSFWAWVQFCVRLRRGLQNTMHLGHARVCVSAVSDTMQHLNKSCYLCWARWTYWLVRNIQSTPIKMSTIVQNAALNAIFPSALFTSPGLYQRNGFWASNQDLPLTCHICERAYVNRFRVSRQSTQNDIHNTVTHTRIHTWAEQTLAILWFMLSIIYFRAIQPPPSVSVALEQCVVSNESEWEHISAWPAQFSPS